MSAIIFIQLILDDSHKTITCIPLKTTLKLMMKVKSDIKM